MSATPKAYPLPFTEDVHPEVQKHLRLLFDRIINHGNAFENQQAQIKALQAQVAALQKK